MFTKPKFGCDESHQPLVPRRRHIEMLVIACIVLVASFLLSVGPGSRVHFTFLPDNLLPKTCFTQEIFGVGCPGCGLTRSFIHLTRLEWQSSWDMHRLGWLMFLATLLQIPYRAQALLSNNGSFVPVSLAKTFGNVLVVLLITNWLGGLLFVDVIAVN